MCGILNSLLRFLCAAVNYQQSWYHYCDFIIEWDMNNLGLFLFEGPNNVVNRVSCGDLRECHIGMEVELCGRVQYQRVGRFLTLRDQYGMTQVVAPDDVSSWMIGGILLISSGFL